VRDVLLNLRDRIVLGVVEDNPTPHPMHGTPRVELGLYRGDTATMVAEELLMAGALFARTVERLSPELRDRPIFYPYPVPATRTVHWVSTQALHECEHHFDDAAESINRLNG
jgi:hypothetical protein